MATVDLRKSNGEVRKKAGMIHGSRPKRYTDIYRVKKYGKKKYLQKYAYFVPRDKKTSEQLALRSKFAQAVHAWQELNPFEKNVWNALALKKPMSGYNYFISKFQPSGDFLLQESGYRLLQENVSKIILDYFNPVPIDFILLENGFCLLQENGDKMILDVANSIIGKFLLQESGDLLLQENGSKIVV